MLAARNVSDEGFYRTQLKTYAALRPIDDDYSNDANSDLNYEVGLSPGNGVDEDIREIVDVTLTETADDDSESYVSLFSRLSC